MSVCLHPPTHPPTRPPSTALSKAANVRPSAPLAACGSQQPQTGGNCVQLLPAVWVPTNLPHAGRLKQAPGPRRKVAMKRWHEE